MEKEITITPGYYPNFPIEKILSPTFCFRMNIAEGIKDLMSEIHAVGRIIEPLIARPSKESSYVELGPGERRLLAARELGMKTVPLIVSDFDDEEFDKIRLFENLARKDLTDYELGRALDFLLRKYPDRYPTQQALADEFQKSKSWVSLHLQILELEKVYPGKLKSGLRHITERQAREILVAPPEKREEIVEKVTEEGLPSARKIAEIVKPLIMCNRCMMTRRDVTEYRGEMLCPSCLEEAKHKPIFAPKEAVKPTIPVKEYKETWEHRKARMQVPVSHMEQRLAKRLTEAGVKFETQVKFCIGWSIVDFLINNKAFYIDFEELHVKREEKDETARSRLAQFYGVEPVGLPYKADTDAEEERLFRLIMDKIS